MSTEEPRCYYIIRQYFEEGLRDQVIKRGLTLSEAQAHCNDPETSYKTCRNDAGQARTTRMGPWFDGYRLDQSSLQDKAGDLSVDEETGMVYYLGEDDDDDNTNKEG